MPDANDIALLQEYLDHNSETAFTGLVQRHINLVYSVALRFTGNPPDAQDVTQAVFIILAQKAGSLRQRTTLTGWLYETTRFTAMRFLRTKARREVREQEACMQSTLNDSNPENVWRQLAPLLEEAMARLSEKERILVALRFFENKSAAETAALLGIQEWAAHKRAARAMEKLRQFFIKRGIASTMATLAGAISANSVQAAPAMLAKTVTATAFAKGATASASTLTLIKGALKIMAWTKAQTAIVSAVVVGMVTFSAIQYQAQVKLREQNHTLQQQQASLAEQIQQLQNEHEDATNRLSALLAANEQLKSNPDTTELLKLRGEVGILRQQTGELQKLQEDSRQLQDDNRRLKQQLTEDEITSKQFAAEAWMRALIAYANNNQGQLPENFEQAESFLPIELHDATPDQYEMLYHGSLDSLTNSDVIVFREKKLWQTENGRLGRFDVLANGRAQYGSAPDGTADSDFSDYEKENAAPITSQ
jgi:RNA polymerase sigma factor (sigma-70 family)